MPFIVIFFCWTGIVSLETGHTIKGIAFLSASLGGVLNFLVVAVNGWRMPVRVSREYHPKSMHRRIDSNSRLVILADIIPIGKLIIISIGDVLLVGGILVSYFAK